MRPSAKRSPPARRHVIPVRLDQLGVENVLRRKSYLSVIRCRYAWISGCEAHILDQYGFCSKEYEYMAVGTSQPQPG